MFTALIFAQGVLDQAACPPGMTPPAGQSTCPNSLQDIEKVFANVIAAAIPFAGIVLFVVLLFAGLNWIMAGSDPKKAESARNMATYAVMGIVALALSFLALRVLAEFTGVDSLLFFRITQ